MSRHVWTVKQRGRITYMGPRLVDAMAAYGDPNDPANDCDLYRDGRKLDMDDGQPTLGMDGL